MKIRYTKDQLYTFILCFGLFICGTTLRIGFYDNNFLRSFSPLFYIGIILVVFSKNYKDDLNKKNINIFVLLFTLILYFSLFISIVNNSTILSNKAYIISIIIPIILIAYQFKDREKFIRIFNLFYKFLKISCIFIVIMGIIDILTNLQITRFIADYTNMSSYYRIINQNRIVSYLGHPLFTSELLIVYYILSHYFCIINNKKENIVDFIIAMTGILLCQSRTGILILLIAFLIFNFNVKKIRYFVIAIIILVVLYYIGALNSIIERFTLFKNGDIRNISLSALLNQNKLNFYLFKSQRMSEVVDASTLATALEYPILRWAYCFGIANTIIIIIVSFIIPIIHLIKDKNFVLLLCLLLIIVDINTYSGLGDVGMKASIYYLITMMILNLSTYLKKGEGNENN